MATGYDVTALAQDLGSRWELPKVGLKFYACPAANQALLDATLSVRARDGVRPDAVKHIQGSVRTLAPAVVRRRHPRTGLESKFCYYHAIAVALTDGCAFPRQFVDERAGDPALASLRDRIDMNSDESLPAGMAVLTVDLTDGRTITERIPHATGSPGNPLSDAQVQEKFKALAAEVLPGERVEQATRALWEIDRTADVGELLPLLCA
jgi:2-methylcitrate dehydratase PrpD